MKINILQMLINLKILFNAKITTFKLLKIINTPYSNSPFIYYFIFTINTGIRIKLQEISCVTIRLSKKIY